MQGGDADYSVLKWNLSVSKNQLVLAKDDERVCVCVGGRGGQGGRGRGVANVGQMSGLVGEGGLHIDFVNRSHYLWIAF